jgi:UDPglucose--hexose-1-phosphate uridylyltransferase
MTTVTSTTLADGRRLIYFDDAGRGADRSAPDTRPPGPAPPTGMIRWDPLSGRWVTVADHRQDRTHRPGEGDCPLCPSRPGHPTEIPADDYDVVVFENRFPAFNGAAEGDVGDASGLPHGPAFRERPANGRSEVVCFTPDHHSSFSALDPVRAETVVDAWAQRSAALAGEPAVEQVFCFENRGAEIGVTLTHPHGQIYGYPFVTPRTAEVLANAASYHAETGGDLVGEVVAAERDGGRRVVGWSDHWFAFVPFAARWPIEVHIYPHRRVRDLPELSPDERRDFARLYLDVLRRLEGAFDDTVPYIAAWHQAPVRFRRRHAYLHLELFTIRRGEGRLKYLAGSESAMDSFVSDVTPEKAARMLLRGRP